MLLLPLYQVQASCDHFQRFLSNPAYAPLLRFLYPYLCAPLKLTALNTYFWSHSQCPIIFCQGLLCFEEMLSGPLHSSALSSFVSSSTSKFCHACLEWLFVSEKRAQICVPYSVFPVTFFSGCLSSHREVLWARATRLEYSVSCGEWVKRPGDSMFCCSHFFKLRQVTARESLTCPHLLYSQTSSDGLEKYIFEKIRVTGH